MATRNLADAHKYLQARYPIIQKRFAAHCPGWKLQLTDVYRSPEEQYKLYLGGYSTIDGKAKKGNHNYKPSRAADSIIVHIQSGLSADDMLRRKRIDEEKYRLLWSVFGLLAQAEDLIWGNDWDNDGIPVGPDPDEKFIDMYHIELPREVK